MTPLPLNSSLIYAASAGDSHEIERLIAQGALCGESVVKALRQAAYHGHEKSTQLLIPLSPARDYNFAALAIAAEQGHAACVSALIPACDPSLLRADNRPLLKACANNRAECLSLLIPHCDARANHSEALLIAAESGYAEIVELLIPVSEPAARDSAALRAAAARGRADCVRALLPVSKPLALGSSALSMAAQSGHPECLQALAPHSKPRANNSRALALAARFGSLDCVEFLISLSHPRDAQSLALRQAATFGHQSCVIALLPVSDPFAKGDDGLNAARLARRHGHANLAGMIEAFIEAQELERLPFAPDPLTQSRAKTRL